MALIFHFKCTLKCHQQFVLIWTSPKILSAVKGPPVQTEIICRRQNKRNLQIEILVGMGRKTL